MRLPFVIPALALLAGCSSYVEKGPRVRAAGEEGEFGIVSQVAANAAAESPRDALVWRLEQGSALRAEGRLKESIAVLEQVEEHFRAEEEKPDFSITGAGLAAFSNGYAEDYRAKPYDRIYASTYQALNQLELGDIPAARVSLTRLRFVQENFGSGRLYISNQRRETAYDVEKASRDPRTREGLSMIQEDLDALTPGATYDDAFCHWLQGVFFLHLGTDVSDREKARKELLAATQLSPRNKTFAQDFQEVSALVPPPNRVVYVILETGMCPEWREQRVDIPLFVVSNRIPFISVALPALRPIGLNYNLAVKLDGKPVSLELASRTDALIAKHFEAALPAIKQAAFVSVAVKATASYLINKSSEEAANRQGSGSGAALWSLATKIGTGLYTHNSTKADLRNWSGLPARFLVARVEARPGQRLTIVGHPEVNLILPEGKVLLVSLKSTKENSPIVSRCTPLLP